MSWEIYVAEVAVAILARTPAEYEAAMTRVEGIATRLHIDYSDGVFADGKTIGLPQIYSSTNATFDLHLMMNRPEDSLEQIISLQPDLAIIHFEAEGDHQKTLSQLRQAGIRTGIAVLPQTLSAQIEPLIDGLDHVLVFTGSHLGFGGGDFLPKVLGKIAQLKKIKPSLEIGVDGGINQQTAQLAISAGADILVSGSFIHASSDPTVAYEALMGIAKGVRL